MKEIADRGKRQIRKISLTCGKAQENQRQEGPRKSGASFVAENFLRHLVT